MSLNLHQRVPQSREANAKRREELRRETEDFYQNSGLCGTWADLTVDLATMSIFLAVPVLIYLLVG